MRLGKDVALTETDGGTVLLDQRSGRYWQLNGSGSLILSTLLGGGTTEQAAEAVVARYPVDVERALADVRSLVDSLRTAKLVRE